MMIYLAEKIKMIVNHGEKIKYHHEIIGCNSRLDSIQAEILNIKLKYLDEYNSNRKIMANNYNLAFSEIDELQTPKVIQIQSCLPSIYFESFKR